MKGVYTKADKLIEKATANKNGNRRNYGTSTTSTTEAELSEEEKIKIYIDVIENHTQNFKDKANHMMCANRIKAFARRLKWLLVYWSSGYLGDCKFPNPCETYQGKSYDGWRRCPDNYNNCEATDDISEEKPKGSNGWKPKNSKTRSLIDLLDEEYSGEGDREEEKEKEKEGKGEDGLEEDWMNTRDRKTKTTSSAEAFLETLLSDVSDFPTNTNTTATTTTDLPSYEEEGYEDDAFVINASCSVSTPKSVGNDKTKTTGLSKKETASSPLPTITITRKRKTSSADETTQREQQSDEGVEADSTGVNPSESKRRRTTTTTSITKTKSLSASRLQRSNLGSKTEKK